MFKSFKYPPKTVKSNLHVVTLEEYQKLSTKYEILPVQKICRNCLQTVFNSIKVDSDTDEVMLAQKDVTVEVAIKLVNG